MLRVGAETRQQEGPAICVYQHQLLGCEMVDMSCQCHNEAFVMRLLGNDTSLSPVGAGLGDMGLAQIHQGAKLTGMGK